MNGRLNLSPRSEWAPTPRDRTTEPKEHRCAKCWGPFGKSAIPCPNEPKKTPQIAAERRPPQNLARLLNDLQDLGYPDKENNDEER